MTIDESAMHQPSLTASSLFAGFSFTAVLSLVMSGKSGVIPALMVTAFIISTAAFIISSIATAMLLEGIASNENIKNHTDFFTKFGSAGLGLGFIAFTIGLGSSGFLYAIWLGVVSVACAGSVLISFVWLTIRLSNLD